MTQELIALSDASYTPDQVSLIKRTIAKGASDDELALFINQCRRTGLDPFSRQIYSIKRREKNDKEEWVDKMMTQVSIDGFRLIAERSKKYRGQSDPMWCGDDGQWKDVWLHPFPPKACKVSVFRSDFDQPLTAVARFDSYCVKKRDGGLTAMWAKMPDIMIAKCAEALALRKAFPQDLSDIYAEDEMAHLDNPETEKKRKSKAQQWVPAPEVKLVESAPSVVDDQPKAEEKKEPEGQHDLGTFETLIVSGNIEKESQDPKKPWTLYAIETEANGILKTFDKPAYEICGEACKNQTVVIIESEPGKYGPMIIKAVHKE